MAKETPKKPASALTTDEALDRLFGKDSAKKLRELVELEDAQKGKRTKKTSK